MDIRERIPRGSKTLSECCTRVGQGKERKLSSVLLSVKDQKTRARFLYAGGTELKIQIPKNATAPALLNSHERGAQKSE